jgi:hypothetical protein
LIARVLPLIDVGSVDTSSVDPAFERLLRGAEGLDLDISFSAEAGIFAHLGPTVSSYVLFSAGTLGWDDFLLGGADQSEAQSSITYDAFVVAGASVGVAWGF